MHLGWPPRRATSRLQAVARPLCPLPQTCNQLIDAAQLLHCAHGGTAPPLLGEPQDFIWWSKGLIACFCGRGLGSDWYVASGPAASATLASSRLWLKGLQNGPQRWAMTGAPPHPSAKEGSDGGGEGQPPGPLREVAAWVGGSPEASTIKPHLRGIVQVRATAMQDGEAAPYWELVRACEGQVGGWEGGGE